MKNLILLYLQIKTWLSILFQEAAVKFQEQFGFTIKEISASKLREYLNAPKDSSSLAMTRIMFGIAMLFDIPDERGGAFMEKRWGESAPCHFPLIPFVTAMPMPYMTFVYIGLWIGALGIALGYKYRWSAPVFTVCYWYLFVVEKSYWNNHSYLFGVVALLFTFTDANCYLSLDVYLDPSQLKMTVPYWNYFILKYQFFILYFMAGLKKGTAEWLTGYSVQNLSEHWVFNPFKLFLTVQQTDQLVVHWFVFAFDLTVAFWMMWEKTRHVSIVFCGLFHLMNSRLFSIGMFPWVCLATMPLFYPFDWPKIVIKYMENIAITVKRAIYNYMIKKFCINCIQINIAELSDKNPAAEKQYLTDKIAESDVTKTFVKETKSILEEKRVNAIKDNGRDRINTITFALILFHVVTQAFLPYSHFITKGYNNWTQGLYGYSWDMMVHTWDIDSVIVKVVDNEQRDTFYVDPYVYSPNDRWTRHGDMVYQYARCLQDNIKKTDYRISKNISIYIDVWCSMNGRFTQRMFDPHADLLKVSWSPFEPVSYLMPLLDEALELRSVLHDIKNDVQSWNNYSEVILVADFPGYSQEKYIPLDLFNISITVLRGFVAYEPEVSTLLNGHSFKLQKGDKTTLIPGSFHKIINIGKIPAFYMYTFANSTESNKFVPPMPKPKLPISQELLRRFINMISFGQLVIKNIFQILFNMTRCHSF